jgi:hypothetical protein
VELEVRLISAPLNGCRSATAAHFKYPQDAINYLLQNKTPAYTKTQFQIELTIHFACPTRNQLLLNLHFFLFIDFVEKKQYTGK